MGIGVQGESCGEVTQHAGHGLDIHTVLEGNGGEGVAEVMESDLRDTCSFQHPLQHIIDAVRRDGATVRRREHIGVVGLALLLSQDFDCLRRNADCPVGILGFQRCFHDLTIHSCYLTAHLDDAILPVDVTLLESEKLTPAQAGCQFDVVHLVDTGGFCFLKECLELL